MWISSFHVLRLAADANEQLDPPEQADVEPEHLASKRTFKSSRTYEDAAVGIQADAVNLREQDVWK